MAIYYFRNSGDVNWGLSTNWSTTDGGPGDGAVPTSSDDAYFTANSGNCTVNSTTRQCKDLIFTGYTNTITVSNILEIYGASLTLGAGMGMAGTSSFKIRPSTGSTITVTSNARAFDVDLILETTSLTVVLADDMVINQSFSQNSGSTITINGADLYLNENVSFASSSSLNGTCDIIYSGTGLLSPAAGQFVSIGADFNINTVGTLTLAETIYFTTAPTYTAGTVVNNGTINFTASGGSMTIPTDFEYNNVGFGTGTYTLATNDLIVNGDLTYLNNSTIIINGTDVYIGGDLFLFPSTTASGTSDFILDGTGTWSQGSGSGYLRNNLTINTAGTITISGLVHYNTGTLTYTAGTVVVTGSTLRINASTTLNTNGMSWNNLDTNGTLTVTLGSDLTVAGQLSTITGNTTATFNGNKMYLEQGITFAFRGVITGTTEINFVGTGTISHASDTANTIINNPVIFDTAGTITFSTYLGFRNNTVTYVSGTMITAGHTVSFDTCTLNCNGETTASATTTSSTGINWNNVTSIDLTTTTLTTPMCIIGTHTIARHTLNGSSIYNLGSITKTTGLSSGTTSYHLIGTGTWSGNHAFSNNLTINTAGTITVSGTVIFSAATLTYTAGTVTTTGSTLTLGITSVTSTVINTNGIVWDNVICGLLTTNTFSSDFYCNNFTMPNTQTVNGSTIYVAGDWSNGAASGTSNVVMTGTGSITMTNGFSGDSVSVFSINTSGTITINQTPTAASGIGLRFHNRNFQYVSGTINDAGFDFSTYTGSASGVMSVDFNGISCRNGIIATNGGVITLLSDFRCKDLFLGQQGFSSTCNGFNIYCSGDLKFTDTGGTETGTTNIILNGNNTTISSTGPQSAGIGGCRHNIYIDVPGKVFINGTRFNFNTGTFAILRGDIIHQGSSELYVSTNSRFIGFDKTSFSNIIIASGSTIEMDRFFSGNNVINPTIISASSVTSYNINITDPYSISHGAQVSRCNVTAPGKLRLTHAFANRGNNTGVLFGQETYGAHENVRTVFTRPEFLQETIDFMTAAGVTNNMTVYNSGVTAIAGIKMWEYLDAHVRNMMGIGPLNQTTNFWTKYVALYPFIGGTAASHKYNLKNPLDADAAYRITFSGTITHNGFGATGVGGGLAWGNTHLIPDTVLSLNDTSIFRYTNSAGSDTYDMGIFRPGYHLYMRLSQVGNAMDNGVNSSGFSVIAQSSTPVAMAIHSRKSASEWKAYYSGNSPITVSSAAGTLAYEAIPIMALMNVGSINNHSLANFSYAGIGGGVTDDEATLLTTIVHDFQKKLNRALYEI